MHRTFFTGLGATPSAQEISLGHAASITRTSNASRKPILAARRRCGLPSFLRAMGIHPIFCQKSPRRRGYGRLMRQESTFQADAESHAGAIGLMQVLPKTGRILAKQLRVRYSRDKLFEPEYNIQLGMLYIAGLVRTFGPPEYALAAFNAGEDRISAWKAERSYEEIPELVESIPFTETRDYVQIVLRNAEVYRMIYGQPAAAATAGAGRNR